MRPRGLTNGASYEQRLCVIRTLAALFFSKNFYSSKELEAEMSKYVAFNLSLRYKLQTAGILDCDRHSKHSLWYLKVSSAELSARSDYYATKMVTCSAQEKYAEKRRAAKCQDYQKALKEARKRIAALEAELRLCRKF